MTLTELSIKRPILIIVFFLIISLLGIFAIGQLKYELLPKINAPFVSISAIYAGASPAEIENSITKKIEDAVAGVSKVKRITSRSNEGFAVISVEFLGDTDLDKAMQEVQRYVNQVVPDLPVGVKVPVVDKFSLSDLPVLRIAATTNNSQMSDNEFFILLKNQIKPRLSQLKGTGRIQLIGGEEKEVKINLNENKLKFHKIPALLVVQALQKANLEIPVGEIKDKDAQFNLQLTGKFSDLKALENLDIMVFEDKSKVKLKDIARLEFAKTEKYTLTRLNQKNAVGIVIQKQSNANAVEVSKNIRKELDIISQEFKDKNGTQKLNFEIADDSSEYTLTATETVFKDLIIAIFLVALVMLVFLHSLRNALIVMIAIPCSLVFSFIGMFLMDFSLNMMTLLAMSLVIGILVDDSIVVLENIYRHLEMGKDKVKASLEGRAEIGFSALSITLVDVVVFLPLAFVPGITGGLVKEFALVIVVSTLASLLVCFTITPMLASRFAKLEHFTPKKGIQHAFGNIILWIEKQINHFTDFYVSVLKKGLKYRFVVYFLSFGSMILSLGLVTEGFIGGEFVPQTDKGEISVIVELPTGSKFEQTDRLAQKIEKQLLQMPEVKRVFNTIGTANDAVFGESAGANLMEMSVKMVDKKMREKSILKLSTEIREMILQNAGTKVKVSPIGLIGAEATPIQILLSGNDRPKMLEYAQKMKENMMKIDGADDVRLSVLTGKPSMDIQINREQMASFGLNLEDVMLTLRTSVTGFDDMKFRQNATNNDENNSEKIISEVPIRIQFQQIDRQNTSKIENYTFVNNKGENIYLKQFAHIERVISESALERRNKNASVMLFSKAIGKSVNEIGAEIKAWETQNPPPQGVKVSYEGDLELADDSVLYLGLAILAGITFMYLIMVALYNSFLYPFVVLFSIPVALTGALLALALTMKTLNVFSIFGLIMMLGLVAKNAILIVDKTNELKSAGKNVLYSLLNAGKTRLRPILMTTLAMVIGMLPLALQTGLGGEYNSALAWVLIGGLSSSMIFTLFIVPAIYLELDLLIKKFSKTSSKVVYSMILVIFLSFCVNNNIFGQVKAPLLPKEGLGVVKISLKNLQNRIETANPDINIIKKDIKKAGFVIKEAFSSYLPTLELAGNYTRNLKPQVFFLPATFFDPNANPNEFQSVKASASNSYQMGLNLNLPLLQFENRPLLDNAKLNQKNADLSVKNLVLKKTIEARKVYFDALWAKSQEDFWLENSNRQNQILAEMRQRLKVGLLMETDTLQVFVQSENIKPSILKAKNAYKMAENQLKLLLDFKAEETLILTENLADNLENNLIFLENEKAILSEIKPENRPDLQQISLQKQFLQNQLKIEKARNMPNLQLVGQYAWLTQDESYNFGQYNWVNTSSVGLQLNLPIFSGFRNRNRIFQTKIQQEQTQETYNFALKQADFELKTLQSNQQEIVFLLKTQKVTLKASKRLYELVYDRFKQGLAKQNDLKEAEFAQREAKFNELSLIYQYLILENEIKRVKGVF